MKVVFGLLFLALAAAAAELEAEAPSPSPSPVYGYHRREGIPKARRIQAAEEAAASDPSAERIVGGSVTDISALPYQAGLVIQVLWVFTSVCGASLISGDRLVTAAHCNSDGQISAQGFTVVLGSNTLFTGGLRIGVNINNVIMHPSWNPNTANSDVAVMRLNTPVSFTNVIQPIALATGSNSFNGQTALASGFGLTNDGGSIGTNQVLSSVNLPVITNAQCAEVFTSWVHDSNICVDGAGGRSTCSGDSGGPLVVGSGGNRVLIGVTSYGHIDGCQRGFPAAFARITNFTSWINSI